MSTRAVNIVRSMPDIITDHEYSRPNSVTAHWLLASKKLFTALVIPLICVNVPIPRRPTPTPKNANNLASHFHFFPFHVQYSRKVLREYVRPSGRHGILQQEDILNILLLYLQGRQSTSRIKHRDRLQQEQLLHQRYYLYLLWLIKLYKVKQNRILRHRRMLHFYRMLNGKSKLCNLQSFQTDCKKQTNRNNKNNKGKSPNETINRFKD